MFLLLYNTLFIVKYKTMKSIYVPGCKQDVVDETNRKYAERRGKKAQL